jgi:hypothetical protein
MFLFIRQIYLSITLRKILIIFSVGLLSRVMINLFTDPENISFISSSIFYTAMVSFSIFISSFPLSFDIFNIRLLKESLNVLIYGNNYNIITGSDFNNNFSNMDKIKQNTQYFSTNTTKTNTADLINSYNTGYGSGKIGAALGGLYEKNP